MKTIDKIIYRSSLKLLAFVAVMGFTTPSFGAGEPTRAEILKGGLGPMRTCYDVTSYHLDVRIDPATKSLKGSNKITFTTVNDFTKMQVDLWANLEISKIIFDDGAEAAFTRELNAVFVELPETAKKGSTHSVTVYYSGVPVVAKRAPWDGGITWDHDPDGNPWVVVTCPETGASIWWPNKEHASDRADNVTISITTPPGLEDISNGRLKARTVLPDGWVRYDWYVSYPIDNYCVTFNIGKFAHFSDDYVNKDGQPLTLDYYVLPKNLEKAHEQFKQVKTMLAVYEKYFGDYPFPRDGYKLVESPHTGMEHQSCIAYGNRYLGGYRGRSSSEVGLDFDFIIIHESAHEWWGNNLCDSDIADMWINESFAAYAESLFVEEQYGRAAALKYINNKKPNVRNLHPIISDYGLFRKSDGDMYDKGQLILNTLRSVLDDDKLWVSILRGLQDTFKHQTVSADDVFGYINKKTGRDFSYFFDQYFKHAAPPTLTVLAQKEGDKITVAYRWEADVTNFCMPVKVTTAPGKYEWIRPTTEWQTNTLQGIAPEDFKMAEDLFYANVKLRTSYIDPRRDKAP
jgi:aminopeptidase N